MWFSYFYDSSKKNYFWCLKILINVLNLEFVLENRSIASPGDTACGEIKLSVQYHRGALTVMVSNKLNILWRMFNEALQLCYL